MSDFYPGLPPILHVLNCHVQSSMSRFLFHLKEWHMNKTNYLNLLCACTISRVQDSNRQLYHPSVTSSTTYDQLVLLLPYMGSKHPVFARSSLPPAHGMLFLFPTLSSWHSWQLHHLLLVSSCYSCPPRFHTQSSKTGYQQSCQSQQQEPRVCLCVCVCVWERGRREVERKGRGRQKRGKSRRG